MSKDKKLLLLMKFRMARGKTRDFGYVKNYLIIYKTFAVRQCRWGTCSRCPNDRRV